MMGFQQLLDALPIGGIFLGFATCALIMSEFGYRYGRWSQEHTADEKEGPTSMILGSILALMAFLLATTMGMATDRFDARRGLVLAEANAIGTNYLRAGYLSEPASTEIRALLREYVPLRIISTNDMAEVREKIARSVEIQGKLWTIAEDLARASPQSTVLALFIDSLNSTMDLHETRITTGIYARVPVTILILLLSGSLLSLVMVGYYAGLNRRRSFLAGTVLIIFLGAVFALVVDLDRPRDGFLKVSEQPLVDVLEQIGAPPVTTSP